jgi:hypothetical protein
MQGQLFYNIADRDLLSKESTTATTTMAATVEAEEAEAVETIEGVTLQRRRKKQCFL